MPRGILVSNAGTAQEHRTVVADTAVIGRSPDCDVVIDDAAASRRHVQVQARGNGFVWRDLGSTNGTIVNGAKMVEGILHHGDHIRIGETVLRFEMTDNQHATIPLRSAASLSPVADDRSVVQETMSGWEAPAASGDKTGSLLGAVYSVINDIASNYEPCTLLDRILETVQAATHAQRASVLLAGDHDGEFDPCPVCRRFHVIEDGRLHHAGGGEIRLSRTVANRVVQGGESILFQDSKDESGIGDAASIMSLDLRSIICVPLRGKFGILGILYIDSNREGREYGHDDMLLATAAGNSAGLALENANMHRQILEKQRMEQEIEVAWTIQQGFLVKNWALDDPRFLVYGETRPAKTVGGDFYDFVRPAPDRVGILIGDVSGKGVPAALTMAQLLAEFRLRAHAIESPAEVLRALNRDLFGRTQRGMFCTMCYLTLDLKTGAAVCANAGHHPPVEAGPGGARELAPASGPPVGILPEVPWTETSFTVSPGRTILMYTDGIAEARCANEAPSAEGTHAEFGAQTLMKIAERLHASEPRALIEATNEEVLKFCGGTPPHDDCTMIAMRYCG